MCSSELPLIADPEAAVADPELAVFSVMSHGRRLEPATSARLALAAILASKGLDDARACLYFDLVLLSISEAAKRVLQAMRPANYEYQSEFAQRYFSEGKAEGKAEATADLLIKLMTSKFGPVTAQLEARIRSASVAELDAMAGRLMTASTLDQLMGIK